MIHILIIWIDFSYFLRFRFLCIVGKLVKLMVLHDVVVENLFLKCWILLLLSKQFLLFCDFPLLSDIKGSLHVLFLFFGLLTRGCSLLFELLDSISIRVGETVSVCLWFYIIRALLRGETGLFSFLLSSEFYYNITHHHLCCLAYLKILNKLCGAIVVMDELGKMGKQG
jgi:hypothetical protein